MTTIAAAFILGFLVATFYGAAFHLLVGGRLPAIPVYLGAAWIGFLLGHFMGDLLGIDILRLGVLQLLSASIGSWLLLLFSRWLIQVEA